MGAKERGRGFKWTPLLELLLLLLLQVDAPAGAAAAAASITCTKYILIGAWI